MSQHRRKGKSVKDSASARRPKRSKRKVSVSRGKRKGGKGKRKTLLQKKRSLAAKKGHQTRKLKLKGVDLDKRWEGKGKDGQPTGYTYERYNLPILDSGSVHNIIAHVTKTHKGKRFLVGGQADFRDRDDRLFTNNASLHLDTVRTAPELIISNLHKTIIQPSNPFQVGRSAKIDVENTFVLVRFKRERFHTPKKSVKRKPVKRKPVKKKRKRK